jgi:hypothetical protein
MAFKELATKRFSVRKYTDEPVSKEENCGHRSHRPYCPRLPMCREETEGNERNN